MSRPILVSIEGNIGSGKSTLLAQLKERNPSWRFIDEPVSSWLQFKDASGKSLLELFYEDKRRWAFTFQNTALLTRLENTVGAVEDWKRETFDYAQPQVFITERCVDTDANVFAKLLAAEGDMTKVEVDLYQRWFHAFASTSLRPSAYIYVDTPPEVCSLRIKKRNRDGESNIPDEYLRKLYDAHEEWLGSSENILRFNNYTSVPNAISDVEGFIGKLAALK